MKQNMQAEFFLPPALVEQALEDFLDETHRALDIYEAIPIRQRTADDRQALKELRRDAHAYNRALDYCQEGIWPSCIDGVWEIDSLSERGQVKHHIWREGGKWACDCKCAGHGYFHVHQAIMTGIERGLELAEQHGLDVPIEPTDDERATLGLALQRVPAEHPDDEPPFLPDAALAWQEHEAEQRLWARCTAIRARYLQEAA
jgi:hypothetical protein